MCKKMSWLHAVHGFHSVKSKVIQNRAPLGVRERYPGPLSVPVPPLPDYLLFTLQIACMTLSMSSHVVTTDML